MNLNHFHFTVISRDEHKVVVQSKPTGMHYVLTYRYATSRNEYGAYASTPAGAILTYDEVASAPDLHSLADALYALR